MKNLIEIINTDGTENVLNKQKFSKMKNQVTIYTSGKSLFTLENYDKIAGVCHPLNITVHSEVSKLKARAMHENGQLHHVYGIGDRKVLTDVNLKRGLNLVNFKVV